MEISVRFHGDSYVARRSDALTRSEWPPAPDRVFQALMNAACHLESQDDQKHARRWLEWLSELPAPSILAVPVNEQDAKLITYSPRSLLSNKDGANPRQDLIDIVDTPLADPLVIFCYNATCPEEFIAISQATAAAVSYVGASESLAVVTIGSAATSPQHVTYDPHPRGSIELPMHYEGRLDDLDKVYFDNSQPSRKVWEPRRRAPGRPVRYAIRDEFQDGAQPSSGDFEVFVPLAFRRASGTTGPVVDSAYFPAFVAATRAAFLKRLPVRAHGILSGHDHRSKDPDNTAFPDAHAAFVPLADLGFRYASSRLRGVAMLLPRATDIEQRREALRAFNISEIYVGGDRYELSHIRGDEDQLRATQAKSYIRESKSWATLTPLRLWKMPNRNGSDIPGLVAQAIRQAGYPEPTCIETSGTPYVQGGRHVRSYAHRLQKPYWLVHALITFANKVSGPMLIGRGRYIGFGLCAPQDVAWTVVA